MTKESISQLARGRFHTEVFLRRMLRDIVGVTKKLEIVRARQTRDKLLVGIRLRSAQLVIEMNDGDNDAKFVTQFNHQPQECNRIDPTRNRDPNPVSGP
jgi:hypothetical protein